MSLLPAAHALHSRLRSGAYFCSEDPITHPTSSSSSPRIMEVCQSIHFSYKKKKKKRKPA